MIRASVLARGNADFAAAVMGGLGSRGGGGDRGDELGGSLALTTPSNAVVDSGAGSGTA